jgi:hypothetical protein
MGHFYNSQFMGHLTDKNKTCWKKRQYMSRKFDGQTVYLRRKHWIFYGNFVGKLVAPPPPTRIEQLYARLPGKCVEEI